MLDLSIRVLVYPKEGKKPLFERIVHQHDNSEPMDYNCIAKALRCLFGRSTTINFELYGYQ